MPSFNSIAQAAMTPGGFQAGVNDIVAAVLNADARKMQAQKQAESQAAEMAFRERGFGETVKSNALDRQYRDQELGFKRSQATSEQEYRNKSLGETVRHNTAMENRAPREYQGDPSTPMNRFHSMATERANIAIYGNPRGPGVENREETDLLGSKTMKQLQRIPSPEQEAAWRSAYENEYKALTGSMPQGQAAPGNAPPAAPGATSGTPRQPPAPMSGGPNDAFGQMQGALDFAKVDAKLQAESPKYKQARSNPNFDWKAFLQQRAGQR